MFGFGKKLTLPGAGEALPGREVAMRVPEKHYVNGHALRPPFPEGLQQAIARATKDWGADWSQWRYGRINESKLPHMFVDAFSLPSIERPGGFNSVNATGANFRRVIDLTNLDRTMATNAPGQSAQPGSPYYGNLRTHLAETVRLEDLAGVAGLSPFHFLRQFQRAHHATPQQMLMALRLFEAKRQLAAGDAPADVAAAVGLADQAHLTRAFAQRYGVTPARYQQQLGTRPRRDP